ncbi:MAG: EamA family transporter [Deltaproteobacteria bacterium]|nr:EamA family transporter [Deltaproteobacteria bacterium]
MAPELIALLAAISYALFTVYGWFGLHYATALVATIVSLASRTIMLWLAVVLTGGIPQFAPLALGVFISLGILQSVISLLTFTGLQKIGTARSQPLRNTYPLWSAFIAITLLQEQAGTAVLAGTMLVVVGVVLITWQPETKAIDYCWWHVLYSLGAGVLAGIAFPLRRYGLTITNEPVFFSAVIAVVSLVCSLPYAWISHRHQPLVWHPRGVLHLSASGFFEGLGALLGLIALGAGTVVVVSPIIATTPLWNLMIAYFFLREREKLNARTALGTVAVVAGTIAITVGR